jgi:polyribonucleotide nucleotidyltransferase
METKTYSLEIGGKTLVAEFTNLAEQAHGSVILRMGNTAVLATAVMGKHPKEGGDFFPLTVDYEERFYAAGEILGSQYVRREGKPSEQAILSGRIIDRTIRPLFDSRIRHDVQVVITVLAIDKEDPDILAVNAASLALATSNIPWNGPVSAVRVAHHNGSFETFLDAPTDNTVETCELVVCGKDGNINMIEMGGNEIDEAVVATGLQTAQKTIAALQAFQENIIKDIGKKKRVLALPEVGDDIKALFAEKIAPRLEETIFSGAGRANEYALLEEWEKEVEAHEEMDAALASAYFDDAVNTLLHKKAIDEGKRPDGRGFDEIRPLFAKAGGISQVLHGTGTFYRGGTHVLSVLTLGGPNEALTIEGMEEKGKKRFMHHYNFPPFSSGETGRMGGLNRRMIGHGALAEKALRAVIPTKEAFPYTIRIVSEAFASNGSTSMGSVCGGTIALLDAGVPITRPVAGIASGLMMESPSRYKVLTDIQGPEDHHGDMDFKVAGTSKGITAIQMDVKVDGVPLQILKEALEKARLARLHILKTMEAAIASPRPDISPYAPKIVSLKIKQDQIGLVIGPGGKTINAIREETGAEIEIEEDGTVYVTGKNGAAEKARDIIAEMTREYKAGDRFEGEVTRILDFGAFVKIGKNTEGLVHISELSPVRVNKVTDLVKLGDVLPVVIKEIDEKERINLSVKRADPIFFDKKKDGKI